MGRISLQKNNNGNAGKRAVGVGNILAGVVAITIMGTGLIMSGCGFQRVAEAATTDTPVATQTANPTATPTLKPTEAPTPKPSPTNTPMPELTEEQKELLLGINNKFNNYSLNNIAIFCVKFNNRNYRLWTVSIRQENSLKEDVYNIFNMEYLFTIDVPAKNTPIEELSNYLGKTNSQLNGIKLIYSIPFPSLALYCEYYGIGYNNNEYFNDINKKIENSKTIEEANVIINTPISKEKILELYLDTTPQEEIPPFWMYIEGATIPDELKGIYTTPTVAPTAFREGNASVRYLTGERDLDTEMENKTKRM